ncbi:MAG: AAA family ATPase [Alphaproteobacteria bacterium]|nr:AAA family ATPase [Alphaproteobacteria bacterium]
MNDNPAAPDRLAAYRAAREADNPAAILATSRAALAAVEGDARAQALAFLRAAYEALPNDAPADAIKRAEADAWRNMGREARAAILASADPPALPEPAQPLAAWRDAPEPPAVVWRHDDGPGANRWPLASVGEPAILSGAGGTGKSYAALALALSAVQAGEGSEGNALGFGVRGGPVLLAAYEDSGPRLAGRGARIAGGRDNVPWNALHVLPNPGPLFVTGGPRRPGEVSPAPQWDTLWRTAEAIRPSLIVLDPAAELIEGADANQPGPVRAFMRALAAASERHNAGVLIVAHDTKGNRATVRHGGAPGDGAVAGSASWTDRARGVAFMGPDPLALAGRQIEIIKANHGRDGWGMKLAARANRFDGFAGWQLTEALDAGAVSWEPMEKPKNGKRQAAGNGSKEDGGGIV